MSALPDGRYDVFVVDARRPGDTDLTALELTILAGQHKGEVVSVSAEGLRRGETDLIGLPGTLTVHEGRPSLQLEG